MTIRTSSHFRKAFTLLELSIVLVIIGLLVGGTLVGTDLIHAAELRSVTNEFKDYTTSITTFKTRYNGLPGDLRDATTYWGEANASAAACQTTDSSATPATCNGNGDGVIGIYNSAATAYERYRFWQHLSNAELLSGSFTGIRGSGGTDHAQVGVNVPASKYEGGGWSIYNLDTIYTAGVWFDGSYGNAFVFGTEDPSGTSFNDQPILSAEDAYNIDSKIDDGAPSTGSVTVRYSAPGTGCSNAASKTDTAATYSLSDPTPNCALLFKSGT